MDMFCFLKMSYPASSFTILPYLPQFVLGLIEAVREEVLILVCGQLTRSFAGLHRLKRQDRGFIRQSMLKKQIRVQFQRLFSLSRHRNSWHKDKIIYFIMVIIILVWYPCIETAPRYGRVNMISGNVHVTRSGIIGCHKSLRFSFQDANHNHLFGAKPLPEPTLIYCPFDSWEQTSAKLESKYKKTKMHLKMPHGGHFVKGK